MIERNADFNRGLLEFLVEVTAGKTMATSTESKPQSADGALSGRDPAVLLRIYEMMVLTRAVEDRMVAMYKSGDLLGSLYTGHWHEAISVGVRGHAARRRLHGADPSRPRRAPVSGGWNRGR